MERWYDTNIWEEGMKNIWKEGMTQYMESLIKVAWGSPLNDSLILIGARNQCQERMEWSLLLRCPRPTRSECFSTRP